MALSKEALENKSKYNLERNKELTKLFCARLPKEEYKELCDYLKQVNMNKAEFVRWAFDKLRECN
jgi:hypothetical protein